MASETRIVWSDEEGDTRKKGKNKSSDANVKEEELILKIRRLTSGKGRVILEITGLPENDSWCKKLAKEIKKSLATGGAYKNNFIEVHGDQFDRLAEFLQKRKLKFKKTGG